MKMLKYIFLTATLFALTVSAYGETSYTLTGEGNNLTLTITGTGNMPNYNFVEVFPPWYSQNTSIKTLIIEIDNAQLIMKNAAKNIDIQIIDIAGKIILNSPFY